MLPQHHQVLVLDLIIPLRPTMLPERTIHCMKRALKNHDEDGSSNRGFVAQTLLSLSRTSGLDHTHARIKAGYGISERESGFV